MSDFRLAEVVTEVLRQRALAAGVEPSDCNSVTGCPRQTITGRLALGEMAPAEDEEGKALQAAHKAEMAKKYSDANEAERQEILEVEATLKQVLQRIEQIKKEKGIQ